MFSYANNFVTIDVIDVIDVNDTIACRSGQQLDYSSTQMEQCVVKRTLSIIAQNTHYLLRHI